MGRYCRCHLLCFTLSFFLSSFPHFTRSLLAVVLFDCFFSSQGSHPNNFHSHTLEFGSAQLRLVQCRQPVGLLYVQQPGRVQSHLKKCQIVWASVFRCVPDGPADPQVCCPPGLPAHRAEIQFSTCARSIRAARRPVLGNDGWTPPHHRQVVSAHRTLLGLFPQVLVFVIT